MLSKKFGSVKKLAKKVKSIKYTNFEQPYYECLNSDKEGGDGGGGGGSSPSTAAGTFPVYVGECRQRFVVPTAYLSHPLFKIMLEKAYDEFGFDQRNGLVIPCSVAAFQEVIGAVECCNRRFDFRDLVQEFI